jgi:hypothetical protein
MARVAPLSASAETVVAEVSRAVAVDEAALARVATPAEGVTPATVDVRLEAVEDLATARDAHAVEAVVVDAVLGAVASQAIGAAIAAIATAVDSALAAVAHAVGAGARILAATILAEGALTLIALRAGGVERTRATRATAVDVDLQPVVHLVGTGRRLTAGRHAGGTARGAAHAVLTIRRLGAGAPRRAAGASAAAVDVSLFAVAHAVGAARRRTACAVVAHTARAVGAHAAHGAIRAARTATAAVGGRLGAIANAIATRGSHAALAAHRTEERWRAIAVSYAALPGETSTATDTTAVTVRLVGTLEAIATARARRKLIGQRAIGAAAASGVGCLRRGGCATRTVDARLPPGTRRAGAARLSRGTARSEIGLLIDDDRVVIVGQERATRG